MPPDPGSVSEVADSFQQFHPILKLSEVFPHDFIMAFIPKILALGAVFGKLWEPLSW